MKPGQWKARVRRLLRGVTHPEEELSRAQRRVAISWNVMRFAGRRLREHRAPQMAAALAYRTIFSLIPLLVLALVALRAVYGEEGIREVLATIVEFLGFDALSSPVEGADEGEQALAVSTRIEEYVDNAVEQVRAVDATPVAVIGVAVLIYSALSLLFQIETSFNTVCGASRGRSFVSRLTNYWTVTTVGTLALVVTIAIGDTTQRQIDELPGWLSWAGVVLRVIASIGVTWLLLVFAYTRMPTVRVSLKSAAIGAVVAAVVWEVLKNTVTAVVGTAFDRQAAVYGSIALIPISLIWVYLTWLIVLFGLELATLLQLAPAAIRRMGLGGPMDRSSTVLDVGAVASVARAAVAAFTSGDSVTSSMVGRRTGLGDDVVNDILEGLVDEGVLVPVDASDDEERRFTITRPPETVRMDAMARIARRLSCSPGSRFEREAAQAVRERVEEALARVPLVEPAEKRATDEG